MKTLIQKDLVYEQGRPLKRYFLTDEGWEVARRVMETALDVPSQSVSPFHELVRRRTLKVNRDHHEILPATGGMMMMTSNLKKYHRRKQYPEASPPPAIPSSYLREVSPLN